MVMTPSDFFMCAEMGGGGGGVNVFKLFKGVFQKKKVKAF